MSATFHRLNTDGTSVPVMLEGAFGGPTPTACWLVGGGPSLAKLPCEEIARSPIPKMAVNLAGTRLLRPTFWTSYDPTARFHRSIYLDAGVMKFVHRRRAMDLVPGTTFKVCECPNTYFFDRDARRGFADFLRPGSGVVVDWADSMVQAIDLLSRLGFRVIYLAGCEMRVRPSRAQVERAGAAGVRWEPEETLQEFVRRCARAGGAEEELERLGTGAQYHFDEAKPLRAAVNTDLHYFRVAQYLRLSRRSLASAGVRLVSVTPHSRLNDYFPYVPVRRVLRELRRQVGDPDAEPVRGLYTQGVPRRGRRVGPMRDYRPHNWGPRGVRPAAPQRDAGAELIVEAEGAVAVTRAQARERLRAELERLPGQEPVVCEEG